MEKLCIALLIAVSLGTGLHAAEPARPESLRDVIAGAKPAVVCVTSARTPGKVLKDSFVDFINPFPLRTCPGDTLRFLVNVPLVVLFPVDRKAMGSGFIISEDGYVVTNNHVIDRANKIKVELPDRRTYKARVVGADPFGDIALLKIEPPEGKPFTRLPLGDSDELHQGDWVVAIGSPFGLKWTCTAGIVSAVGRNVGATKIDDLIQMEASLDSGNSGGPLINTRGQAVGINTAAILLAENKGFAVPINMVREVLPNLKEHGEARRGWIGVSAEDLTPELAKEEDLDIQEGAVLSSVKFRSPARKAGLRAGDVVVEFDGRKVTEARELCRMVRQCPAGTTVDVVVYHRKARKTLRITPGELKERLQVF